jgi:hypothetical protein
MVANVGAHLWGDVQLPASCGRWPTVQVIGAQKSATTSLFLALLRLAHAQLVTYSSDERSVRLSAELHHDGGESCCSVLFNRSRGRHPCSTETHFLEMCDTSNEFRAAHRGRFAKDDEVDHLLAPIECERYPQAFDKSIGIVAVDATPTMLSDGRAPKLLHWLLPSALLPEVRLIVTLRQPTARLYSIYQHKRALKIKAAHASAWTNVHGTDKWGHGQVWLGEREEFAQQTFDQWAQEQIDLWGRLDPASRYDALAVGRHTFHQVLTGGHEGTLHNATGTHDVPTGISSDLIKGYYALQLQRWLEVWPRRQMLILDFHALVSNQSHVQSALAFATSGWARALDEAAHGEGPSRRAANLKAVLHDDVRNMSLPHTNVKNTNTSERTALPSCEMQRALDEHYAPHNWHLFELLDRTRSQRPEEELPFRPFGAARVVTDCPSGPWSDPPPEASGPWSDRPTAKMQKLGAGCSSIAFQSHFNGKSPDCKMNELWRRERYCSFSCFVYGLGYN